MATQELIDNGGGDWSVPQEAGIVARRPGERLDDSALADRMGENGKSKVEAQFFWPAIDDGHLELYSRPVQQSSAL